MKVTLKITIMTGKGDWFAPHARRLVNSLSERGHEVNLVYCVDDICEGDICFLLSVYGIVDREVLTRNKNNIVIHESDLPRGKGWSPLYWQVLEGKSRIPVCLFEAAEKVDAGSIYARDVIELRGDELVEEIREKQAEVRQRMALQFVDKYPRSLDFLEEPDQKEETFYRKRSAKDSELSIHKTISEQFNLLRIVDNDRYPAFFYKDGSKYLLRIEKEIHVDH